MNAATPQARAEAIKRLASQANAAAALLDVLDMLPECDRINTMIACHNLADDVSTGLFALMRPQPEEQS